MKIAVGSDPNAAGLKNVIGQHLTRLGHEWEDLGSDDSVYANVAFAVAEAVVTGQFDRGILMCGTGIGMSIAANKVAGANAALCADSYSTERSVKSNNANIMTLGSLVTGTELAKNLVGIWLRATYAAEERSEPKNERIEEYVKAHCR